MVVTLLARLIALKVEEDLIDNAIDCLKAAGFTFSNENEYYGQANGEGEGFLGSSIGSSGSGRSSYKLKYSAPSMVITKLPYQLCIPRFKFIYYYCC